MVDFKLTNGYSPMLFSQSGYQVVVMPMLTTEANEQAKRLEKLRPSQPRRLPMGRSQSYKRRSLKRQSVADKKSLWLFKPI